LIGQKPARHRLNKTRGVAAGVSVKFEFGNFPRPGRGNLRET
jgi:hypothetical protein